MTIKDFFDFVVNAGAVCGALAAIGLVVMYVFVRPTKRWIMRMVATPVAAIHDEVTPNHGTSMKDDVAKIKDQLSTINERLTLTTDRLDRHLMRIEIGKDHDRYTPSDETRT